LKHVHPKLITSLSAATNNHTPKTITLIKIIQRLRESYSKNPSID
jgi:hypothetical protein